MLLFQQIEYDWLNAKQPNLTIYKARLSSFKTSDNILMKYIKHTAIWH